MGKVLSLIGGGPMAPSCSASDCSSANFEARSPSRLSSCSSSSFIVVQIVIIQEYENRKRNTVRFPRQKSTNGFDNLLREIYITFLYCAGFARIFCALTSALLAVKDNSLPFILANCSIAASSFTRLPFSWRILAAR